jgi:hypothetical protein
VVELEGVEPSAGISVRRDRHAALAPHKKRKANVPWFKVDVGLFFHNDINYIANLIYTQGIL